ncbi:ROK family protein [Sphingomonas sp. NIBR02145]|uniref:ROK family protein n=1 Tax=Sphingomonas sp. NIBR02145 TaxID=3014784 RepID=UPI0022B5C0E2|nr:ROK family protein [Sphingomonas sp. NIBR02145]WHU03209.1 ROK family protein [Sphingomonas sp. NIBR02145]
MRSSVDALGVTIPDGKSTLRAGIELGGTKCVCTLASGPDDIRDQRTVPTTRPDETLPAILAILREWDAAHGFAALGIASFGPIDINPQSATHGQILATTKAAWPGTDVLGILSAPFDVPVGFDTDVNGAALAEMAWGCARGMDDFAYVTVGTGVGVGLVVHGLPTRGFAHSELGHIRVPRLPGDDLPSFCSFHDDCVEGLASGSALKLRLGGRSVGEVAEDDPVWAPIAHTLAMMCHAIVSSTAPYRIAIGGGVVTGQSHLLGRIEAALRASLNGYMTLPDDGPYIVAPALGDKAGPLGAIAVADLALAKAAAAS